MWLQKYLSVLSFMPWTQTPLGHVTQHQESLLQSTSASLSPKGNPVPGGSAFRFCEGSRDGDVLRIDDVEVESSPPGVFMIDGDVRIMVYGNFSQDIHNNATLTGDSYYLDTAPCASGSPSSYTGNSTHCKIPQPNISGTVPLCRTIDDVQQPGHGTPRYCPPIQGPAFFQTPARFGIDFDWKDGVYGTRLEAKTAEGDRIYCLEAEICLCWWPTDPRNSEPERSPFGCCKDVKWPED